MNIRVYILMYIYMKPYVLKVYMCTFIINIVNINYLESGSNDLNAII